MEVNYFDIGVSIVILFLGLKGILNGFFKEVFGLVGIVGGIFVASRLGNSTGTFLNDLIFNFESSSAINFSGFLSVLVVFWLLMLGVGALFKKLTILSGLGPFDKILGFIFGASKFFFIAAVIAHASYNIKAIQSALDKTSLKNSIMFPILTQTGAYIMKLDPVYINEKTKSLQEKASEIIKQSTQEMSNNAMNTFKDSMPNMEK